MFSVEHKLYFWLVINENTQNGDQWQKGPAVTESPVFLEDL